MSDLKVIRKKKRYFAIGVPIVVWALLPEWPTIPVTGAGPADWNQETFWYEPWGALGVHKGIDIFSDKGVDAVSPTYGVVIFRGELKRGGKVIAMLGPKWRIHYLAHLDSQAVYPGYVVSSGSVIGTVGNSGNAAGKQPHVHYSVVSLIPYPWLIDGSSQGWKKMFYLDPNRVLRTHAYSEEN